MRSPDLALQVGIGVLSIAAAWMIGLPTGSPMVGWGFVLGLVAQPLWIFATARARQWGMLACAVFYSGAFAHGIYNHFTF